MKTFAVQVKSRRSLLPLLWGLLVLLLDQLLLRVCGYSDLSSITVPWSMCCHQEDSSLSTGDPEVQGYLTDRRQKRQEMLSLRSYPHYLVSLTHGGSHTSWIRNVE